MLRRSLIALLLVATTILPAQAAERFRVISAETAERLERRLVDAAGDGYRMLLGGRGVAVNGEPRFVVLLERSEEDRTDYVVLAGSGDLRSREAVEARAAEGYRVHPGGVLVRRIVDFWLPPTAYDDQTVIILERRQESAGYEYESVALGRDEDLYRDLTERRKDGYGLIGMWNSGRRLQFVLERSLDSPAERKDPGIDADEPYRLLIMATRKVLKMKLKSSAKKGYRVVYSADPSTDGPPILLLEKRDIPVAPMTYRFMARLPKKLSREKFARKLNKRTRGGWRITPAGVTDQTVTLERISKEKWLGEYLTLSSNESPGLPRAMADAVDRGFRPIRMFVEPSETTVLLEKLPD